MSVSVKKSWDTIGRKIAGKLVWHERMIESFMVQSAIADFICSIDMANMALGIPNRL